MCGCVGAALWCSQDLIQQPRSAEFQQQYSYVLLDLEALNLVSTGNIACLVKIEMTVVHVVSSHVGQVAFGLV